MADPIEVCIGLLSGKQGNTPTQEPVKKIPTITSTEYFAGLSQLTLVDYLLVAFLTCGIVGFILSTQSSLSSYAEQFIQLAFLGIISFVTLKTMNTKLLADLCMTCQGLNPMHLTRRIDVVLSFMWANMQTFVGLLLNVMYYFLVFYMLYILLRSHLFYRFGDYYQSQKYPNPNEPSYPEYDDTRIFSLVHSRMSTLLQNPSYLKLILYAIGFIIYWACMFGSIAGITMFISIMIADTISGGENKTVAKIKKIMGNGIMSLIIPPFLATAITLMLKFASAKKLTFIDAFVTTRIVPAISFTTITSGFNFIDSGTLRSHTITFCIAMVASIMYAFLFIKPIAKKDGICNEKGDIVANDNPSFVEFKNRFVMGHYAVGVVVLLSYICVFGGKIGTYIVLGTLLVIAIVYMCVYVLFNNTQNEEEGETI